MTILFFSTQDEFRTWLQEHHKTATELVVGYHKVGSGKPSMTWSQSVDQALCFGWIDGVRRSIDEESYSIRFTPRRITSIWSAINIKKVEELTQARLMTPEGQRVFDLRKEHRSRIYSYEDEPVVLEPAYEKQFKANLPAWEFFNAQAPSYKKVIIFWIMNAKQEKTRLSRLESIINLSSLQKRKQ
jgi:uncharacterized protein YdeI (YjbR/CyaY-like superfamily)